MRKFTLFAAGAVVALAIGGYAFVNSAASKVRPSDFDNVLLVNVDADKYQRSRLADAGNYIVSRGYEHQFGIAVVNLLVRSRVSPMDIDRSVRAICNIAVAAAVPISEAAALYVVAYQKIPTGAYTLNRKINFLTADDLDGIQHFGTQDGEGSTEQTQKVRRILLNRLGKDA